MQQNILEKKNPLSWKIMDFHSKISRTNLSNSCSRENGHHRLTSCIVEAIFFTGREESFWSFSRSLLSKSEHVTTVQLFVPENRIA